uniref:Uncharacterized protein n=1 Tax=Candidatus Methanogaster sp. ANME-2c ERB4 TaxID=2759911 RepID=A0A7G9YFX1_9EURY|nr:hypothetical protein NEBILACO_00002 [Methanosarcinales archaeon ANME-2c ERB4]
MLGQVLSPLFVAMDKDLRIAPGPKEMTLALQLLTQIKKVINLSVKDHLDGTVFIPHRLSTSIQIDDAESPVSESNPRRLIKTLIIRSTVPQKGSHFSKQDTVD